MVETGDKTFILPGDSVHISNKSDYNKNARAYLSEKNAGQNKPIALLYNGENAICVGGDRFSGLGMQNYTESEIRDWLAEGYKKHTGVTIPVLDRMREIRITTRMRVKIQ